MAQYLPLPPPSPQLSPRSPLLSPRTLPSGRPPLSPKSPISSNFQGPTRISISTIVIIALWATFLTLLLATVAPKFLFDGSVGAIESATDLGTGFPKDHLGAVACESSICSKIGIDILRQGGNAADALIASTLCVGVIGMYHSGIGGGGFMLVRSPNGSYESIDFRETAPASASQDMYKNNVDGSLFGGLAR